MDLEKIKEVKQRLSVAPKYDPDAEPVYDVMGIQKLLPHRPPFLMVDRIIDVEPDAITGIKTIGVNEYFFRGHFPTEPVVPGVLLVEAMAQVGGIAMLYPEENRGKIALFGGMDNIKFKKPVVPGDQLVMKAELMKVHGDYGRLHAESFVDGVFAAQGDFTFALQQPANE